MPERDEVAFTSERLTMRPWRSEEADHLLDIRRRPEVARWLSDPEPWDDLDHAERAIQEWAERALEDHRLGVWAIVPTGLDIPVGTVMLKHLPGSNETEIGWYLHPDAQRNGYAVEAAAAALRFAAAAGIERVWAIMWPDNLASALVAERAGMVDLGIRPDRWYGTESDPDSRMFRFERPPGV